MRKIFGRLIGVRALKGWVHSALGFLTGVATFPFAVVLVMAVQPSKPVAPPLLAVIWVVLIGLLGLPDGIRRGHVHVANALLGTNIPRPVRPSGGRWPNRLRTAAWSVVQALGGGVLAGAAFILLLAAMVPVGMWLNRGGAITYFDLELAIPSGVHGLWVLPLAVFYLALMLAIGAAVTAGLRRLAPVLLGPRTAEKVAVLEERTAVLSQRNRLAQELHDSIGHTLTSSTIQAAVAGRLMDEDPVTARRALSSIEESSRAALEDLDHVLGLLRDDRAAAKAPQRTLADLPALFEHVRRAGTPVTAQLGSLDRVPPTVSREAYRIVQEGLTNAMRHAAQAPVTVRVEDAGSWLDVELTNPIPALAVSGSGSGSGDPERRGHGLVGIVDRVRLLRGEVTFSPVEEDGGPRWRLAARLPMRSGA